MQKKLLMAVSCFTLTLNLAHASPYVGLSSGVIVNTNDNVGNFRGIPLTLSAGYSFDVRSIFSFGGEAFFTPATGKLNSSYGNYLTSTYGYGLSFIPGVQLSEHTVGYARLGWAGTHFENHSGNANGGQFGLGLKTSVTQNWDERMEYDITSYDLGNKWNPLKSSTSTVRSDQFMFGVVYRFV
jgi:opacity protein-like surface antigen